MPAIQPSTFNPNRGVILSVGFTTEQDRAQIVMPMFTDSSALDATQIAQDACNSFNTSVLPLALGCISTSASCVFIQAEGAIDGVIPYRIGFGISAQPGTRTGENLPSQVTGLCAFYPWPGDLPSAGRLLVAKTNIPYLSVQDVAGDTLANDLEAAIQAFGNQLVEGYPSVGDTSSGWYRVVSAKPRSAVAMVIIRGQTAEARSYVATQRRRLKPRSL